MRTTLEIYAQGVPELGKQAAAAMGAKFLAAAPRDERAMESEEAEDGAEP